MKENYYWTILIESSQVSASLWKRKEEETNILVVGDPITIEEGDYTKAIDLAISSCSEDVPDEAGEPSSVVFGVPPTWVLGGNITQPYLGWLKEACEELTLTPSGFIVLTEAIVHDTKQREGVTLSAFLIGKFGSTVTISRFNMGQPSGSVSFEYDPSPNSLSSSLSQGFAKLAPKPDIPPSRIIVYGSEAKFSKSLSDLLIDSDWEEISSGQIAFLQTPQVETFKPSDLVVAVSVAASSEIGTVSSVVVPIKKDEDVIPPSEIVEAEKQHEPELSLVSENEILDEIGFVYGKDVAEGVDLNHQPSNKPRFEDNDFIVHNDPSFTAEETLTQNQDPANLKKTRFSLPSISLKPGVARKTSQSFKFGKFIFLAPLVFLVVALLAWYFLPSANVLVSVSPRSLSVREVFAVSEGSGFDPNTKTVPVTLIKQNLSGQKTIPATGARTVGEKAKGSVVVRNGTAAAIKLPVGTLLSSSGNLRFTTDVAASVSAAVSPTTPGTANVTVVASQIGSEYNLSGSETLTVGGFSKSEIDAIVETGLTGGSSRQVTAVSKSDLDTLESQVKEDLVQKLRDQIGSSVPENSLFIPESVRVETVSREFDRKVGDEASNVSLSMSADATAIIISKEVISQLATTYIGPQVPQGFLFDPNQVEIAITAPQSGKISSLEIVLTANLLPDLDPVEIATRLSGKRPNEAEAELSQIPGFEKATVTISPPMPQPVRFMPFIKEKIAIEIEKSR